MLLLINGEADVVYDSRFKNNKDYKNFILKNMLANKFLTFMTNILYGIEITDMETCYKAFKQEVIKSIVIEYFEPGTTAKKIRLKESAISYQGRTHNEGKKNQPERLYLGYFYYYQI